MRTLLLCTAAAGIAVAFICVAACTGDDPEPSNAGELQKPCAPDGTCLGTLVCTQGVCLPATDAGASSSGSSSGASSSGTTSSSGGSSSSGASGSSSGDSAVDSGCNSPAHGDGGPICGSTACPGDGGWACCRSASPSSCYASNDSTSCNTIDKGVYVKCDGPHSCASNVFCCLYKADGFAPYRDAGTSCGTRITGAAAMACSGAATCGGSIQVCDKSDPSVACQSGTCTTVEVEVDGGAPFFADVCL